PRLVDAVAQFPAQSFTRRRPCGGPFRARRLSSDLNHVPTPASCPVPAFSRRPASLLSLPGCSPGHSPSVLSGFPAPRVSVALRSPLALRGVFRRCPPSRSMSATRPKRRRLTMARPWGRPRLQSLLTFYLVTTARTRAKREETIEHSDFIVLCLRHFC